MIMKNIFNYWFGRIIDTHLTELLVEKGYQVKALSQYNSKDKNRFI